jgi:hypothetical protein
MIRRLPNPILLALIATVFTAFLETLLPFESSSGSALKAKILLIFFYLFLLAMKASIPRFSLGIKDFKLPSRRLVSYLRFMCLLGPIFLLFDRVVIRGFDLRLGIAALRYFLEDNSTGSISSPFSVLGYIACATAFILLSNFLLVTERIKKRKYLLDVFLILWAVFGVSLLTGGRTTLFLLVGFIYMNMYVRVNLFKIPIRLKYRSLMLSLLLASAMLTYVNYVFSQRAETNDIEARDYYTAIVHHLHGEVKNISYSNRSDFALYTELTLAYFTHQFWIFNETLNLEKSSKYGTSIFIPWKVILSKTKLFSPPQGWYYGGFYVPLLGSFVYEFGWFFGFLTASIFLMTIYLWGSIKLSKLPSIKSLTLFNYFGSIIIFSFVLPSVDIMMSPILFLALFVLYPVLNKLAKLRILN